MHLIGDTHEYLVKAKDHDEAQAIVCSDEFEGGLDASEVSKRVILVGYSVQVDINSNGGKK